jgi:hypothetical protein
MENDITPEEADALEIVRSILSHRIDPKRIGYRKAKTYFPIVVDNNNQKTLCRIYLNGHKYIGTLNNRKVETRTAIASVNEIANFYEEMLEALKKYTG